MAGAETGKRIAALKRIAKLYGAVETMHSVELSRATSALNEAETAVRAEQAAGVAANLAGRAALTTGDREEWMLTDAEREMAGWRRGLLEGLRVERDAVREAARKQFLDSRVQTEQMKSVVTRMKEQVEIEQGRRMQASSDDRYLTRLRWRAQREKRG